MSYNFYKVMHLSGILILFMSLGGVIVRNFAAQNAGLKRLTAISNGVGMILVFVAGFGLFAKSGIPLQGWVIVKITIWVILGGLLAVNKRKPEWSNLLWITFIVLGVLAAFLATTKPF